MKNFNRKIIVPEYLDISPVSFAPSKETEIKNKKEEKIIIPKYLDNSPNNFAISKEKKLTNKIK